MSGRRWAVAGAVSFLTASTAGAQSWSTPSVYCTIGASFCLQEFFAFALSPARFDGLFGVFPRFVEGEHVRSDDIAAAFRFEDVLRSEEEDVVPPTPDIPRDLVPEVPDPGVSDPPRHDVPDPPPNEIPDDIPRDEHPKDPDIPGEPPPPDRDPPFDDPVLVPEPSTLVLLGATLPLAIGFIRGRRKRR